MQVLNFRGLVVAAGFDAAMQFADADTGEVMLTVPLLPGVHDLSMWAFKRRVQAVFLEGCDVISGQPEVGAGDIRTFGRGDTAAVQEYIPSATHQQRAMVMQVADEMQRRAARRRDLRARHAASDAISVPDPGKVEVVDPADLVDPAGKAEAPAEGAE